MRIILLAMRALWLSLGVGLTGLGLVGFVVPGLPGTIFLILALACFKKSSPRMESWLLQHPWFGSILRDWEANGWISARVKAISVTCIVIFGGGSLFSTKQPWAFLLIAGLCVYGIVYILTRPTKPSIPVRA